LKMSALNTVWQDLKRVIEDLRVKQTYTYQEIVNIRNTIAQAVTGSGSGGLIYHGQKISTIQNITNLLNLNNPQTYQWVNVFGRPVYLTKLSISPVNGNPVVTITVNNNPLTGQQNPSQPTQIQAVPLTLYDPFDYSANFEAQEIEIPPKQALVVAVNGGTGTLLLQYTINIPVGGED